MAIDPRKQASTRFAARVPRSLWTAAPIAPQKSFRPKSKEGITGERAQVSAHVPFLPLLVSKALQSQCRVLDALASGVLLLAMLTLGKSFLRVLE
jgi:hypothetical protein